MKLAIFVHEWSYYVESEIIMYLFNYQGSQDNEQKTYSQ